MTLGEKLKEARKAAKMTQEQLANILSVSRQAITKWECDKGIPDVENLKLISQALSVSIDYLLDDGNKLDMSAIREPINLDDYKGLNATGKNRWFKWDKLRDEVVREKFPNAEIYMLLHKQIMTKKEKKIGIFLWLTTPFANMMEFIQSLQNTDKLFYLVEENEKQYLAMVTKDFIKVRRLARQVSHKQGDKFEVGNFEFAVQSPLR